MVLLGEVRCWSLLGNKGLRHKLIWCQYSHRVDIVVIVYKRAASLIRLILYFILQENERSLLKPENTGRSGNCGKLRLQNDKNLTLSCPNINEKLKEESNKHRPITRCNSAPGLPGANSRKTQQSSSYPNMLNVGGLECKKREPAEETGTTYDKCRCSSTEEVYIWRDND